MMKTVRPKFSSNLYVRSLSLRSMGSVSKMMQTQDESIIYDILLFLKENGSPAGAGSVQRHLDTKGYSMAEATVGRLLREMDFRGLTEKHGNQGRTLSEGGLKRLRELEEWKWQDKWTEDFMDVLDSKEKGRLIELLTARRPVEIEVAKLAAENATKEDIDKLRHIVEEQEDLARKGKSVSHLDTEFHLLLAKASGNQILEAIVGLLRKKQEDANEFEVIRRKTGHIYNTEHRKIFEAIEQRDADMAKLTMRRHLDNLMQSVEKTE